MTKSDSNRAGFSHPALLCFSRSHLACLRFFGLRLFGLHFSSILILFCLPVFSALAQSELDVPVHYLEQKIERPPVRSELISRPEDAGLRGAELGIADNNTTGKFLKQRYTLQSHIVEIGEDAVARAKSLLSEGPAILVLNVPADIVLSIADLPEATNSLLFNAGSMNNELRSAECRSNVLHTMASRAMLSDALMQFLAKRRWQKLFLIEGAREGDMNFAESIRRSAKKFGLKIVEDKRWLEDADIRRSASSEVPLFTQAKSYDAVVVADEDQDFSPYLPYNTWLPRPVVGSAGMVPVVWSKVIEQWGALQLQTRFEALASRTMNDEDYAAWAAVRSIGEAVIRTTSNDIEALRNYILSDKFQLAGFKGYSLNFRTWNGQLRQPIPLVQSLAVVANTPIEGFLHKHSELDTLGLDRPESACAQFF